MAKPLRRPVVEPPSRPAPKRAPPGPAGGPRRPRKAAKRRLPPIDFPELPILIADEEELFPELPSPRTQGRKLVGSTLWIRIFIYFRGKATDFDRFSAICLDFRGARCLFAGRRDDPLVLRTRRSCRQARHGELDAMREELAQELPVVQRERQEAARELRQSCVAEAEAVDELQKALTAAFGTVID